MKLTNSQIDQLYKFTRKHYVEHYDVQTELVDHLANNIEEIWVAQPQLSFQDARDRSFKKFGVFGFMSVVEAKQKNLSKKCGKILWSFLKEWFSLPKLILTFLIFFIFYTLLDVKINKVVFLAIMLGLAICDVFLARRLIKKASKRFKVKGRKYLLEDLIFRTGSFNSIIIFSNFFHLSNFSDNIISIYAKILFASLITLAIIFSYVTLVVIPQKAEELLQETYPEYKIVKNL
ncbi:hypothetical protein [uncultured Polaribacter sp.]|uniref:hypothetical protein n=1 Tax=uncultured Polaribacter sp. TaxID=174711 RepID=UPI0026016E7D|nr:hypothetical protein [uncultured Polaribacter sp.]